MKEDYDDYTPFHHQFVLDQPGALRISRLALVSRPVIVSTVAEGELGNPGVHSAL